MQAQLGEKDKDAKALQARLGRQQADIEQLRGQYRTAQQNYDRQVCASLLVCSRCTRSSSLVIGGRTHCGRCMGPRPC